MTRNENKQLSLGIDVGSTTVKVVLLEGEEILYQEYQRHMSQVRQKTLELLQQAAPFIGDRPFTVALSGSAGLGLAESVGISFVQ